MWNHEKFLWFRIRFHNSWFRVPFRFHFFKFSWFRFRFHHPNFSWFRLRDSGLISLNFNNFHSCSQISFWNGINGTARAFRNILVTWVMILHYFWVRDSDFRFSWFRSQKFSWFRFRFHLQNFSWFRFHKNFVIPVIPIPDSDSTLLEETTFLHLMKTLFQEFSSSENKRISKTNLSENTCILLNAIKSTLYLWGNYFPALRKKYKI